MSKQELNKLPDLFPEIRALIDASRQNLAITVNAEISMLYWHIGKRIRQEVLQGRRADYGSRLIASLSKRPTARVRQRLERKTTAPLSPLRRDFSRPQDCLYTVETINLVAYQGATTDEHR